MTLRQNGRDPDGRVDAPRYGAKVRALRRRESLNQVQLAEKLAISPSYLNLIENNRRPLPANLLIRLAQLFNVDVHSFATDEDTRLVADLTEAFADPMFEERDLTSVEFRPQRALQRLEFARNDVGIRVVQRLIEPGTENFQLGGLLGREG